MMLSGGRLMAISTSIGSLRMADLGRHRSRKHNRLARTRQLLVYLHDVIEETHVQHAVGLIQNEVGDVGEVG